MRMKKGISLIVLVITIIVMTILAATVIISLENTGMVKQSKQATNKTNYAQEITRLEVLKNGILTDNLGKITLEEYENIVRELELEYNKKWGKLNVK